MNINIADNLKRLRMKHGITQEKLADFIGVSAQAVSKWERGDGLPDISMLPLIANFFCVSIDELFGYNGEREKKVDALIACVNELDTRNSGIDVCLDDCLRLLREGMAEFPGNEKITLRLASLLSETGWIRLGERSFRDSDGYSVHDVEYHKQNEYWNEAIKLFESLVSSTDNDEILQKSKYELILLYRNIGEYEKAASLAITFPSVKSCREIMLTYSYDGKKRAEHIGDAILDLILACTEQLMQALMATESNFASDLPVKTTQNAIKLFDIICTDGNYGIYNSQISCLYLYLSEHQWRFGAHDEAFESLDRALDFAKAFHALDGQKDIMYTAPLINQVKINPTNTRIERMALDLPRIWPMWCIPDFDEILGEMQADPRWDDWVRRTQE